MFEYRDFQVNGKTKQGAENNAEDYGKERYFQCDS